MLHFVGPRSVFPCRSGRAQANPAPAICSHSANRRGHYKVLVNDNTNPILIIAGCQGATLIDASVKVHRIVIGEVPDSGASGKRRQ